LLLQRGPSGAKPAGLLFQPQGLKQFEYIHFEYLKPNYESKISLYNKDLTSFSGAFLCTCVSDLVHLGEWFGAPSPLERE
jgi:hypothetical protein